MSDPQTVWRGKSDEEILTAASSLDDYTDEGRRIIAGEAARRGLNIAPLMRASATLSEPSTGGSRRCAYCATPILFGGKKQGNLRFCNDECKQQGIRVAVSHQVDDRIVKDRVLEIFNGACPGCRGPGPIDVHTSYRVWSAIVMTSWSNRPVISCAGCGKRANIRAAASSVLLGWWGFPWGIIMTPVQVSRNIVRLMRLAPDTPSSQLELLVRLHVAEEVLADADRPR